MKDTFCRAISTNALITRVGLMLIVLLLGCGSPPALPGTVALTSTPTQSAASAVGVLGATVTAHPPEAESTSAASTAAPTSVNPPSSIQTETGLSPAYDIYIGMNLVGAPCGWDQNAGGFSRLAWVSVFYNIRFTAPPAGWTGASHFESEIASGEDWSVTELADYAWCPTYESDQVYECFVTEGPYPFKTHLYVKTFSEFELDEMPLLVPPVSDPLDEGPELYLAYQVWGSDIKSQTIISAGDGHLGSCEGLGGADLLPPDEVWAISWRRVMKGEEFIKEFGALDEDGTQVNWMVHFVPVQSP